jgi:hypothetical protein
MLTAHQPPPLSSLSILDSFPSPIKLTVAGIAPESAATATRRKRRLRASPDQPRPPFEPPSSPTPIARLANPAGRR